MDSRFRGNDMVGLLPTPNPDAPQKDTLTCHQNYLMMILMKAQTLPRPGRPKTSPLSRLEQVRAAKRAQRERERAAGVRSVSFKLGARDGERLRVALQQPDFETQFGLLLDDLVVEVAAYENLALLCWNRRARYISAADAFALYERNWRLVDQRRIKAAERALIERLAVRYGNGVLNV
jgi:hypothetical protein